MRITKSTKTGVKASKKVCGTSDKPLTKDQVKDLWNKKALFIDFGDSDAMCQDNGYTLDQILDYMDKGNQVYVDSDVEACGDVKASTDTKSYKECLKDALIAKGGYRASDLDGQELCTLESWAKDAGINVDNICACGDVKASRTAKEKFLGTALLENRDDGKIHLNNFPVAPNDRCRYMWKNTMLPTTWNTIDEAIDAIETTLGVRVDRDKLAEMTEPTDHTVLLYLYGTNKAIMSTTTVSANDQALQHIKAAIDILGKSGNKDAITKDTIANLGVVMLDIKASTKGSAEVKITKESDNWQIGTVSLPNSDSKVTFEAKVYDLPSNYGINNGRISKLLIKIDDEEVCNYDRGWDKKPSTANAKTAYKAILEKFA